MPKLLRNLKAKMDQMGDGAGRALFRGDAKGLGPRRMMEDVAGRAMARAGQSPVGVAPPVRANRPVEPEMSYKKGGNVKDSKAMAKKEIAFMKKKGAPKSMIKHEKAEYGMKKGGMAKSDGSYRKAADGVASKGKTKGKMVKMNKGGYC
jgi:hypothetical protein